jgi:WD40 repeat protein
LELAKGKEDLETEKLATQRSNQVAEKNQKDAEWNAYRSRIIRANAELAHGDFGLAESLLEECPLPLRGLDWQILRGLIHEGQPSALGGHRSTIWAIAHSPDGSWLATGDANRTIRLWDCKGDPGYRADKVLKGHKSDVQALAFTGDGRYLASGGFDGSLHVWDLETGQTQDVYSMDGSITSLAIHPNGDWIAAALYRGPVRILSRKSREVEKTFETVGRFSSCVAFSPDGQRLALHARGSVRLVEVPGWNQLHEWPLGDNVNRFAFNQDGSLIAIPTSELSIALYDVKTGTQRHSLRGHTDRVQVSFNPKFRQLVSVGWDRTARVWDIDSGRELYALRGHKSPPLGVSFAPDGKDFVSAGGPNDGELLVWPAGRSQNGWRIPGAQGGKNAVAFVPGGDDGRLVMGSGPVTIVGSASSTDKNDRRLVFEGAKVSLMEASFRTGKIGHLLGDLGPGVSALRFSSDRKLLAVGTGVTSEPTSGQIRVYDFMTEKLLAQLDTSNGPINDLLFAAGDTCLVTCEGMPSAKKPTVIHVWDWRRKSEIRRFEAPHGTIYRLALSPDGTTLAAASEDKKVRLWSLHTGELRGELAHPLPVGAVAFSPDGNQIATGSGLLLTRGDIRIWDVASQRQHLLGSHFAEVYSLIWPEPDYLFSGSSDRSVKVWSVPKRSELLTLHPRVGWISSMSLSGDARLLAVVGIETEACVYDLRSRSEVLTLRGHKLATTGVVFHPSQNKVVSASADEALCLWDLTTSQCEKTFKGHIGPVLHTSFHPQGAMLASTGEDRTAKLWNPLTTECMATLVGHEDSVTWSAFSPDGKRFATTSKDRTIRLWDLESFTVKQVLRGHTERVSTGMFHPDSKRFVSASDDGTAKIWDIDSCRLLQTLQGHVGHVTDVACSPDGQMIVTVGADRLIIVWDAANGQEIKTLYGCGDVIQAVLFAPDGKRLLTLGNDRCIRFWDIASGLETGRLVGHSGKIYGAAFDRDGRYLATTSEDATVRIWDTRRVEPVSSRDSLTPMLESAHLCVRMQDAVGLRRVVRDLVAGLEEKKESLKDDDFEAIKICCLVADDPMTASRMPALAARWQGSSQKREGLLGEAYYRAGDFTTAERHLKRVEIPGLLEEMFLALAQQRLGAAEESSARLEKVREALNASKQPYNRLSWEERMAIRMLQREAGQGKPAGPQR